MSENLSSLFTEVIGDVENLKSSVIKGDKTIRFIGKRLDEIKDKLHTIAQVQIGSAEIIEDHDNKINTQIKNTETLTMKVKANTEYRLEKQALEQENESE